VSMKGMVLDDPAGGPCGPCNGFLGGYHGARPLYPTVQCRSMIANNKLCKEQTLARREKKRTQMTFSSALFLFASPYRVGFVDPPNVLSLYVQCFFRRHSALRSARPADHALGLGK
jgi:hypothetical protein